MNFYAIVENRSSIEILRIPLSGRLQIDLTNFFVNQELNFLSGKDEVPFDGNYKPSNDEIFAISNFVLSQDIIDSASNSVNFDVLDVQSVDGKIKAIYAARLNNGSPEFSFQHFDSRKILANTGISLYLNGQTYTRFDQKGIVVSGGLTAAHKDGTLYFTSYFNARKFLNLAQYYQEATEDDIDDFVENTIFEFEDAVDFRQALNSQTRKKIKEIQDGGVLTQVSASQISTRAAEFGIALSVNNDRLNIPNDKKVMKEMIKFLDEDYFITPLTDRRCVTNSKRELDGIQS